MLRTRYLKAFGILILVMAACGTAQPYCTMTVSSWQSLQTILDAAPPGAVICLGAGVWAQGVSLKDKILTIWGAGPEQTVLMGSENTDGLRILGQSVVTVRGLAIYNFRDGIVISNLSRAVIRDVWVAKSAQYGLHALGRSETTLENSFISYNRGGILAEDAAHVTVLYSQIFENAEDGIWLDFASWGWLADNTIQGNGRYGVRLYSLENLFVCWRNRVRNNRAGDFYPEAASQKCL